MGAEVGEQELSNQRIALGQSTVESSDSSFCLAVPKGLEAEVVSQEDRYRPWGAGRDLQMVSAEEGKGLVAWERKRGVMGAKSRSGDRDRGRRDPEGKIKRVFLEAFQWEPESILCRKILEGRHTSKTKERTGRLWKESKS